jgi:hypothetical protein
MTITKFSIRALFECEADGRIDDEQPDEEGQQAERRQIEMKAVGQALEIAFAVRRDQAQPIAGDGFKSRAIGAGFFSDQQPRDPVRHLQQALRDADVDHQHAGDQLCLRSQRRQDHAVVELWRGVFWQVEIGESLRRDQGLSRRQQERLQGSSRHRRRGACFGRHRDRLDAQQPNRSSADLDAAFDNRRYAPAGATQIDEQLLRKCRAVAADQHGSAAAAECRGSAVVADTGLLVQSLHPAP